MTTEQAQELATSLQDKHTGPMVLVTVNSVPTLARVEAIGKHAIYASDDVWFWLSDIITGQYLGEWPSGDVSLT